MTEEHNFKLSLLENGLDFIIRGIDELYELYDDSEYYPYIYPISQPQRDYKYGVLHLFSGFLLLLKERLSHHMPELIFEGKIEDIRNKLNKDRELNTVNLDTALERLRIGPKVNFSKSDTEIIKKMQKHRNRFEHYKFSANKFEINKIIIDFIDLIDRFLLNELEIDITSTPLDINPDIREKVLSIESVYKRMTDKRKRALMEIGNRKLIKFESDRENILEELNAEVYINKGSIDTMIICPECNEETLIVDGEYSGVCANDECSSCSQLTTCDRCSGVTVGYDWEENWCENCMYEIECLVNKED